MENLFMMIARLNELNDITDAVFKLQQFLIEKFELQQPLYLPEKSIPSAIETLPDLTLVAE